MAYIGHGTSTHQMRTERPKPSQAILDNLQGTVSASSPTRRAVRFSLLCLDHILLHQRLQVPWSWTELDALLLARQFRAGRLITMPYDIRLDNLDRVELLPCKIVGRDEGDDDADGDG